MENEIPGVLVYESEDTDRVVGDIPRMRKDTMELFTSHTEKKKKSWREGSRGNQDESEIQ